MLELVCCCGTVDWPVLLSSLFGVTFAWGTKLGACRLDGALSHAFRDNSIFFNVDGLIGSSTLIGEFEFASSIRDWPNFGELEVVSP